jgi:hypothetical protein
MVIFDSVTVVLVFSIFKIDIVGLGYIFIELFVVLDRDSKMILITLLV